MLLFEGRELPLIVMIMQLAWFNRQCAGFPVGGSRAIAGRLEERYRSLGGKISFGTAVTTIDVSDATVTGLTTTGNRTIEADIVISAADWYFTIFQALGGRFTDASIAGLAAGTTLDLFDSAMIISLGVARLFPDEEHLQRFPFEPALDLADGSRHDRLETHIFNYAPELAPKGKTVLSITIPLRRGDFWIDFRHRDPHGYNREKHRIADAVIDILDQRFGNIKNSVEVFDLATPATFARYTGNRNGSIQGWMPGKKLLAPSPVKNTLPGLRNFYMVGHWLEPGGGLPIAMVSARNTVQEICRRDGKRFTTEKA